MGRVARYKKVKSTIKNFGQLIGDKEKFNNPLAISKNEKKSDSVNGFLIEGDSKNTKRKLQMLQNQPESGSNDSPGASAKKRKPSLNAMPMKSETRLHDKFTQERINEDMVEENLDNENEIKSDLIGLKDYLKKKPDESVKEYNARVDRETRERAFLLNKRQSRTALKKREFLKQRSERKKSKKLEKIINGLKKSKGNRDQKDIESDNEDNNERSHNKDDILRQKIAIGNSNKRKQESSKLPETRRVGLQDVVVRPPVFTFTENKERFKKFSHKFGI